MPARHAAFSNDASPTLQVLPQVLEEAAQLPASAAVAAAAARGKAAAAAPADYFIVHGAVSSQHPATLIEASWHTYHYFTKHPPPGRFSFVGYPKPNLNFKPKQWWTKWSNKVIGVRKSDKHTTALNHEACQTAICVLGIVVPPGRGSNQLYAA